MRDHPNAIMLFAAGFGTRMRPLTDTRPKPLIEVAGRALLDHALALADGAGLSPIVVNAHYLAAQIGDHLRDRDIHVSVESPEILDTGGGLRAAMPPLGEPKAVYTLNTDAVWTGPNVLDTLRETWDPARMDALLALVPIARAQGHKGQGDFSMAEDGALTRGRGYVYCGAQIMATHLLDDAPPGPFSLNHCWTMAAATGRLFGAVHSGGWCDVGHPAGIAEAEALLAAQAG